jgi:transcriptional regulator with XRE-family HTH domain
MYSNPQKVGGDDVKALRCEAGQWLKILREKRGLSQRQLASKVGIDYYTFISQLETGRGRIPPDRYEAWAKALGISAYDLVYSLMRYYDPVSFKILFDDRDATAVSSAERFND